MYSCRQFHLIFSYNRRCLDETDFLDYSFKQCVYDIHSELFRENKSWWNGAIKEAAILTYKFGYIETRQVNDKTEDFG